MDIKLKEISRDDLKVGDIVGIAREVRCGWGTSFRHRCIYPANNIGIEIENANAYDGTYVVYGCESETSWELGYYSTKEKAIKVLDMIQAAYEKYEYEKVFKTGLTLLDTFQMPEDTEVEK